MERVAFVMRSLFRVSALRQLWLGLRASLNTDARSRGGVTEGHGGAGLTTKASLESDHKMDTERTPDVRYAELKRELKEVSAHISNWPRRSRKIGIRLALVCCTTSPMAHLCVSVWQQFMGASVEFV